MYYNTLTGVSHRRYCVTQLEALNSLHEKAFDRGLITIDENLRLTIAT